MPRRVLECQCVRVRTPDCFVVQYAGSHARAVMLYGYRYLHEHTHPCTWQVWDCFMFWWPQVAEKEQSMLEEEVGTRLVCERRAESVDLESGERR